MDKFKQYKSYSTTYTVTPDSVAEELLTIYQKDWNDIMYGESALDIIAHTNIDNFNVTPDGFVGALYFLNTKLDAVRKTISFWDAYQIRETIDDKEQFLGQLAAMPVNSSIVSNLRVPFTWIDNTSNQSQTIYQGDLFIKDYNNRVHLIRGISQGSYQPQTNWTPSTTGSSTYTLTYFYTEKPDSSVQTTLQIPDTQPAGYNYQADLTTSQRTSPTGWTTITIDSKTIAPVVKYYTLDHEQVFLDQAYSLNNTRIVCENTTTITLKCEVK